MPPLLAVDNGVESSPSRAAMESSAQRLPAQILVLDDNDFFLKCISTLIEHDSELKVCSTAHTSGQLLEIIRRKTPDLFMIDLSVGTENGLDIARKLRRMQIRTPIILTSSLMQPTAKEMQDIGNCRFASKYLKPADLIAAIKSSLHPV